MTATTHKKIARYGLVALLATGALLTDLGDLANVFNVPEAEAQYGTSRRVARRTARRTSRRYAGASSGGGGYAAAPSSGCMVTGAFWECGGIRYQQAMQGDQVVLVPVEE